MNYALQAPNCVLRSLHNCDRPWSGFTYQPPLPKISVSNRPLYMKRCCNVWQGEISALSSAPQGLEFRNGFWTGILGQRFNIYSFVYRLRFWTLSIVWDSLIRAIVNIFWLIRPSISGICSSDGFSGRRVCIILRFCVVILYHYYIDIYCLLFTIIFLVFYIVIIGITIIFHSFLPWVFVSFRRIF